jgi:hypothetical protein
VVNFKDPGGRSAVSVEFNFSPLLHIPSNNLEFVVGPKLGFYGLAIDLGDTYANYYGYGTTVTYTGVIIGLNAGLFAAVSPSMAIGGLFSFSIRKPTRLCVKVEGAGEDCGDVPDENNDTDKVLGFNGALLF